MLDRLDDESVSRRALSCLARDTDASEEENDDECSLHFQSPVNVNAAQ